ncbi:MAG: hypothetical protein QOG68_1434, partial [Solirubrobacteraceae bacterium]|nr:hypothetical protein [Solirubrobacteraceae bacterium]
MTHLDLSTTTAPIGVSAFDNAADNKARVDDPAMIDFTGKVAVVVGASRGIGRACAVALARHGATVYATARDAATADEVATEITAAGGVARPLVCDVRDTEATQAAIAQVAAAGALDVLVANAGVNPYYLVPERITPDQWDTVLDVNLRGAFFAVQAAGRTMVRRGAGAIVSVSSASVQVGAARGLPYTASKGGLDAMTRSLALDWAATGVRVNGVAPGYVETDLTAGIRENEGLAAGLLAKVPI